jgi:hypothetical protein
MAVQYDFLLLETGSYLLLEDGGKIIIAERDVPTPPSDDTGGASYGRGDSGRGTYIDWSLPRKRWIDREDELFIIIEDSDYI